MIPEERQPILDKAPGRFDKPADLPQGIEQLAAGLPHAEAEFDKVKNRHLGQGAGALNEIRGSDDPAKPANVCVSILLNR